MSQAIQQPIEVTDRDVAALLAEVTQVVRTVQAIVYGRPPSVCPYCGGSISYGAGRWWGVSCDHEGSY